MEAIERAENRPPWAGRSPPAFSEQAMEESRNGDDTVEVVEALRIGPPGTPPGGDEGTGTADAGGQLLTS
jgi:hypothetical protein